MRLLFVTIITTRYNTIQLYSIIGIWYIFIDYRYTDFYKIKAGFTLHFVV